MGAKAWVPSVAEDVSCIWGLHDGQKRKGLGVRIPQDRSDESVGLAGVLNYSPRSWYFNGTEKTSVPVVRLSVH